MRRTFRRHIRKTLAPEVPPILQEANFAFSKGEYGRAAELFERIAQGADARGGLRAPFFHVQAGRARMLAGQTKLGMPSLQRGLQLFAQRKQFGRLQNASQRAIAELNQRGLNSEAAEIEALVKTLSPTAPVTESQPLTAKRPALPTHCPHCGAGLRPDEVEWLDEVTAECAYCGSSIRDKN